jgi:hypothetical protein
MHAHRNKTWSEAAGLPETSVRLARLPQNLIFPDDFPEPIQFDVRRKQLVYRGFMSSRSYAFLRECSPDLDYLRALDYLFQDSARHCSAARSHRQPLRWRPLLIVFSMVVAAVAIWVYLRRR